MEQYERDFKGVFIPAQVYLDRNLSALDKIILTEIDSLSHMEKGCIASNAYLAEFCDCSESKVSKSINKLIELGYVTVESFNGRVRVLQGCIVKNARQTSKKCQADWHFLLPSNNSIVNESMAVPDVTAIDSDSLDGATAPDPVDSADAPSTIIGSTAGNQLFPEVEDYNSKPAKNRHSPKSVIPTLDEVKAFIKEKGYHIDPDYFYEYYDSANWHYKDGKPVKNWKQAMVTWQHNNYGSGKPVVKKQDSPPQKISKSFKAACEEIGVHWEPSYERIASTVNELRTWFFTMSEDKDFAERNKWSSWTSLHSLTGNFYANFWHSYISYIADLLKGEQPKPGHFKVGGGAFNSWCIEMELKV